jgi:hypothetical protein
MWIIGHLGGGGTIWAGDASGASWSQSPDAPLSYRIAVDSSGQPWAVDGANELITGIPQ